MNINFYKYHGSGNDFIIIDDRNNTFDSSNFNLIASLCKRSIGIGADGLILLRNHREYDFEMLYFNSNGHESTMCGNGGRCIVAFANNLGVIGSNTVFKAIDGVHKAKIIKHNVTLQMTDVLDIKKKNDLCLLNTGSPHCVKLVDDIYSYDVLEKGRELRNSPIFLKHGVNVNFVEFKSDILHVRTYERGVEAETLSCGTGVVAAAISMHHMKFIKSNFINIKTIGGELSVSFENNNDCYNNIWLCGPATLVYSGNFKC
jgi:diaminopimelate epimerase